MKSSYDSQKHRELRATKEALREHARWQISTGKTPTQIIGILKGHGCFDAENFLRRLWNKELETQDKQVIRKIPASSIPPVRPVQKTEEPKRSVKQTSPLVPTEKTESPKPNTVTIFMDTLTQGEGRGGEMEVSQETWENIQRIKNFGDFVIDENIISGIFTFQFIGPGKREIFDFINLERGIAIMMENLTKKGIIPSSESTEQGESLPTGTVKIYLETLEKFSSGNKASGIEVSTETWGKIQKLRKLGDLTVKVHQENQFRFRFMPRETGGPHTSYGYTLDEAMGKLWGYLQELEIVSEKPSDTVKIDIDDVVECTGTGPGVVTIPRKTLKSIVKLNAMGKLTIIKEDTDNYFSMRYYCSGKIDYFSGKTIEEIIPKIVKIMEERYPERFQS